MKWRIDRIVHAPAPALPVQKRSWPCGLILGRPLFVLQPAPADDDLSRTISQVIGDPAFSIEWEQPETWEALPPSPWQRYLAEPAPAEEIVNARYGEIALALGLLPRDEWRRRQPLDPTAIREALRASGSLPQRWREAFVFALFEPNGPWDPNDELLAGWTQAVRAVLHQRRPLAQVLTPNSLWLALGYRLLDTISRLRATRPTLAELETAWQTLQLPNGERLPWMFAVVYWGEGAYRLNECGDTPGAAAALDRQNAAAAALTELLPALAPALDGGLWRHHLGQLAYYRGDFPEALRQFQHEWRLQGQRLPSSLKGRLQRSLGNVLTDMGLLASARRLAEAGLAQQRASDDPELFKTLGRLGEIQLRQGDHAAARIAYEESWERQKAGQREGRSAVYLGHLALLAERPAEADEWYQTAEQADREQEIAFNPYLVMGRIALAWRRGDCGETQRLWDRHQNELEVLGDEKVLPAAVAALAVALETGDPELAGRYVERLLDAHYLLEALCPLARCAAAPGRVERWLQRIAHQLHQWQTALDEAASDIADLEPHEPGAPGPVAARIEQALAADDWQPLAVDLARAFPMNLLGDTGRGHPPDPARGEQVWCPAPSGEASEAE
ncbi:MAG: tetratricopeptide repeat protein [Candidatus Competibacter sp.]|nr:tetratricopeptide repeat protein [Candidatus Competibacter sp.]